MINYIKGILTVKKPDYIVVESCGIGYQIYVSLTTYSSLPSEGSEVLILIQQFVKDNGIFLYGFLTEGEKKIFNLLNKVSKIGPKLALAILSGFDTEKLKECILSRDAVRLSTIPGIGRKTAERIVLELKDKLGDIEEYQVVDNSVVDDVISALMNLGYKKQECTAVLKEIDYQNKNFEEILKESLKKLTKS
ncbi:Holliday junction branch migration protein RuvA [Deferribacter autotrophicus]|uniref:Holliday junction branch migration complex subunit RuvA n=1 Tax=Deferribacter autotrophicus TaxID=500465 RepID=A0A5A8F7S7_9BACT|nr:Holliday junction branch migration protein RuvA [Deferribacter autotrophicus]KAA0258008.1 Holliday junction branch migration protein RuvA [Deferribacter autotrophicus]